ncbi:MAG: translation elongation factor 4 [Candidatus Omnitrophica bacterium]|nr:translation elongation factor 4 [Candidatus Omnitrophota bacterium]
MKHESIRNFCIIAHIDHGKSTLADRILQMTGAISKREFENQLLDSMDLEKERGITIKASAVRVKYQSKAGKLYTFNLIDTPGHIDFSFEVSKSLRAVEGALLVVDAAQGVEAQTVANLFLALENNITVIPVINKIDLPNAEPERVKEEVAEVLGVEKSDVIAASAKMNIGIDEILERIVTSVPPPEGDPDAPLQALIFDSMYDTYRGVIAYVRIMNGSVRKGGKILMMANGSIHEVLEVGFMTPKPIPCEELLTGEAGYVVCNIREAKLVEPGDTITDAERPASEPLAGYRKMSPMVYAGIFPVNSKDLSLLRDTIAKLNLNDSSFVYESENSASFGFGFRCGFLGLLHMEIVQERLEREYNLELVVTSPSVVYQVVTTTGEVKDIDNPSKMPEVQRIVETREPYVHARIIVPKENMGTLLDLCEKRRGKYLSTEYIDAGRVRVVYDFPLAEIIVDFNDKIKSLSKGYGSMDYEVQGFRAEPLVKVDILLNGEICEALSMIAHRTQAADRGRRLTEKLKEVIPRQMIDVAIQAAIGGKIIARSTVGAMKKDVTSKCYGGDITRKRKLLEKQKEGKKRMKQFGSVSIPQEAFMAVLQKGDA